MEDIIIIGAGVTGCAIARELSRDQRKILVLERCSDVPLLTSKPYPKKKNINKKKKKKQLKKKKK